MYGPVDEISVLIAYHYDIVQMSLIKLNLHAEVYTCIKSWRSKFWSEPSPTSIPPI